MKVAAVRRVIAVIALGLPVLPAALALAAPAPAPKAAPARGPAAATNRLTEAMPDTVLAKVFTGTGAGSVRMVTRRQVDRAAARAGRRLDALTPQDRREFLDVLVDQAVLVARVSQEPRRWEHRDSVDWNALRDRLVLRAALDSAMVEMNFDRVARGDSLLGPQQLGIALRDSTLSRLAPRWNDAGLRKAVGVLDTLPQPDSRMSMIEQMRIAGIKPTVNESDGALLLAESDLGPYRLADLVRDYARLNPMYRPHVSSTQHVKELVGNWLFEGLLRRAATERQLEKRPMIASQLAERAEYLDVSRFVAREVYAKISLDSLTLRRHFESTRDAFDWEERAHVVRVTLPSRAEAEAMARRLAVPSEAESLAVQSARAGVPYTSVLNAGTDTTLFGRVRRGGVGTVLGPDSTAQGWRVLRVMALEPKRHRTYDEAEPMVKQSWYDREGERLMRELLDGLRRHSVVVRNEKALGGPRARPAKR